MSLIPPLTFAVGGLDYPRAVQVVWVEVWEARWQDGASASLDVTATQGWRLGDEGKGKWDRGGGEKMGDF